MDRARADRLHYRNEAALAARLTDRDRTEQMRELFELYLAFQRGKSPEEIVRELRADWTLNRGRMNPRYRALLLEASRTAGDGDDRPGDR